MALTLDATTRPQSGPPMSVADIYANARSLAGYLREKSDDIDAARRLPPEVAARLREAGMFRLMMPKAWGGPELSPAEQVEVIEQLAMANSSAAWCVMIGCDSGFFAGYLDDAAGREIYPRLDMATAGSILPNGRAERVDGGFRVTGQWPFGSGISHADVIALTCRLYEKGVPLMGPKATPVTCTMLTPAAGVEIVDNWHTTGMRGTGSSDYRVTDLFVLERFLVNFRQPAHREGILWRRFTNFLQSFRRPPRRRSGRYRSRNRSDAEQGRDAEWPRLQKHCSHPERHRRRRDDARRGPLLRFLRDGARVGAAGKKRTAYGSRAR